MADRSPDPYATLGIAPGASDSELRAAYRRQAQLHHPDHNGGSAESARRFEAVQEAYARIRVTRASATAGHMGAAGLRGNGRGRPAPGGRGGTSAPPPPRSDPAVEARMADLERELREAQRAQEEVRAAARAAAESAVRASAEPGHPRPSDEELGYIQTEDSFTKIFSDAAGEISDRLSAAGREHQVPKRLADLIDELGSKLTGEPPHHD